MRGGYVLHRPILVDVTPSADGDADNTIERTLTMQMPVSGEPQLAAELAGCAFMLVGPNTLHGAADAPVTIGRSRRCDLRIDNESVSKVHGSISYDEARGYVVVDENSRNGTRVNGQTLAPGAAAAVYAGAQVAFGDATFVFIDPPTLRKLARLAT
ncbi:MAG: FHA domain-containing protein [Myxococcales bacterium]|nr:FHA domain-containing protein [Myxococcales bacterium]MBK7191458.1 FHA domain-containing protein [Myxococcales bacterium]MBP6846688.1 FHA domain-containing protein [Kofleriaceae bacterium]